MWHLFLAANLLAPPTPVAPPDDPEFKNCFKPGPVADLHWMPQQEPGIDTWLLVKRRDENGEWQTWVRQYVRAPPFALNMRSARAREGDFAWVLFAVNRATQEVAAGEWRYFCTRD
jgi:hypothetical protein